MGCNPYSEVSPLFSVRTVLLTSSENCCSIDADAWCKGALSTTHLITHTDTHARVGGGTLHTYVAH